MLPTMCVWYTKGIKKTSRLQVESDLRRSLEIYYRGDNSWFGEKEIIEYIKLILLPFSKTIPKGKKGLIIADNLRSHTTDDVRKAFVKINFILFVLPPNSTSFL